MRAAMALGIVSVGGCVLVFEPDRVEYIDGPPPLQFGLPVADALLISRTIGVDHDAAVQTGVIGDAVCTDYLGRAFPFCYDGHKGSDFILEGGFDTMDAGSLDVVAAADGIVVFVADGHYDRCHVDGTDVSCDGFPKVANRVVLEHQGRLETHYLHLMNGSVTVEVGDEVRCGDPLGRVGSSGNSSLPHLHFQVQSDEGSVIDPYAGPNSQDISLWEDQGPAEGVPLPGCTTR